MGNHLTSISYLVLWGSTISCIQEKIGPHEFLPSQNSRLWHGNPWDFTIHLCPALKKRLFSQGATGAFWRGYRGFLAKVLDFW